MAHAKTKDTILLCRDLQIDNGGRTTTSPHYTKVKNGLNPPNVHTQANVRLPAQTAN